MKVIGFYNRKGGCGKTVSAINVASILAKKGYKTLLLGLDPQNDLSAFFGFAQNGEFYSKSNHTIVEIMNDIDNEFSIKEAIYPTKYENLFIVPGNTKLEREEKALLIETLVDTRVILTRHLFEVKDTFDYVVIDMAPAGESLININGIVACDYVYIPIMISENELEGLQHAITICKNLRNANPKLKVGGTFFCRNEKWLKASKEADEYIKQYYPELYMDSKISKNKLITDLSFIHQPLIEYDKKLKINVTNDYINLTNEIIEKCGGNK